MIRKIGRSLVCIFIVSTYSFAQTTGKSSISGRITIKGNPAPGMVLTLEGAAGEVPSEARVGLITRTDQNGNFRFDSVPKGEHLLAPRAYEYVLPLEMGMNKPGRRVFVGQDESVEGINLDLVPGAVITGKISENSGRPAVLQTVKLMKEAAGSRFLPYFSNNFSMFQTDDRGVYRVFGLPAGRYQVSVGVDMSAANLTLGSSARYSPIRYYPGVEDKSQAKIIDLNEGQEVTEVDITMAKTEKTYRAKVRIYDVDSGAPVVGAMIGYGAILPGTKTRVGPSAYTGERTNENGEITLYGMAAGKYRVIIRGDMQSGYYTVEHSFEVSDHDIEGVEIPAKKGASLSGRVEFQEGGATASNYAEVGVSATSQSEFSSIGGVSRINPDGTFQITGLPAGKTSFAVNPPKSYHIVKMEREGAKFPRNLELSAGEKVTGIVVTLAKGTGSIKGQVKFENGSPPEGLKLFIVGFRVDEPSDVVMGSNGNIEVDSFGRFTVEGLLTGDYEIRVVPMVTPGGPSTKGINAQSKVVPVGPTPAVVTYTIDLGQSGRN